MATVGDIMKMIDQLSVADGAILISSLANLPHTTRDMESFVTDERFSKGRVCPHCGCMHVVRNGHRPDGGQRYVCKDCGKSFVITSNTIVHSRRNQEAVGHLAQLHLLHDARLFCQAGG